MLLRSTTFAGVSKVNIGLRTHDTLCHWVFWMKITFHVFVKWAVQLALCPVDRLEGPVTTF